MDTLRDRNMRLLGRSGLLVNEIALGGWAIGGLDWNRNEMGWGGADDDESLAALRLGHKLGANFVDTADIYGHGHSERLIGQLVAEVPRETIKIGTKVGYFAGTASSAYHPLHLRHQLEMSLVNLNVSYVEAYFLHNFNFGPDDRYLRPAITELRRMKDERMVRAIGMRGPHRFSLDRELPSRPQEDKYQRFLRVADLVEPDLVQMRFNMLTPAGSRRQIFDWADNNDVGLLLNKPLAQGLLLDKYDPERMPQFDSGDHRRRKRWFQPQSIRVLKPRLARLKARFGGECSDLARVAIQYCLAQSPRCCVVVGFRNRDQVATNLSVAGSRLSSGDLRFIEETMDGVNAELGRYFGDGWS